MSIDPSGAPGPAPAAPDPMAALADVRNQLLRVGQQIAEMRTDPTVAGAEAANGVIAELREAVRFLAERLDGVARMVAQRGEELADTRGALSAIDAHVRSQAETIGVLTTGMQALPSYGERISGLHDAIGGLQQRLSGIEGAFAPLAQRLGGIESAVSRPDSGVSERLAAIEGMLSPLSQRLGQSLTETSASLHALHGRVEALAAGTQAGLESVAAGTKAALATPVPSDGTVVAELEPTFAALAAELAALRKEVAGLKAAPPSGAAPTVDLGPLREQIAELLAARPTPTVDLGPLREQIAELLAARPAAEGAEVATTDADLDAAIASAESRIKDHVDDAVLALAQTLLGKQRVDAVGAVAPVDAPAAEESVAAPTVDDAAFDDAAFDDAAFDDAAFDDAARDEVAVSDAAFGDDEDDADTEAISFAAPIQPEDVDEYVEGAEYDDGDGYEADGQEDAAGIDFSSAQIADEQDPPIGAWSPSDRGQQPSVEHPDDLVWGEAPSHGGYGVTGDEANIVPEKRRRWFSW